MLFGDRQLDAPAGLTRPAYVLRPLLVADAVLDHAAVMESRDQLRVWEQSTWPEDDFTIEANRADLERHQQLHEDRRAFTYTVMNPAGTECLGCVYVFPIEARFLAESHVTPVGAEQWEDVEAVVYHWVRTSRLGTGLDVDLLAALRSWFASDWPIDRWVFVTGEEHEQQRRLVEATDLELSFTIEEPDKAGRYLAYRERSARPIAGSER